MGKKVVEKAPSQEELKEQAREAFAELRNLLNDAQGDMESFFKKDNMSAARRTRSALQQIKKIAHQQRINILNVKNMVQNQEGQ